MKYDPKIVFECDGCNDTIEIELEFVYRSYNSNSGYYDHSGCEDELRSEGWIVDEDKHFCCDECSELFVVEAEGSLI